MHTFEIRVAPETIRSAWKDRLKTRRNLGYFALTLLFALGGTWVEVQGDWSRPLSTPTRFMLSGLGLILVLYALFYFISLRRVLATFSQGWTYTLTGTDIQVTLGGKTLTHPWTTLAEITRTEDALHLHYLPSGGILLPLSQIPPAALAYLVETARTHGAKVTGV